MTGFFLLPGLITVPFVYTIDTVRDGASYSTRIVKVTQAEGKGVCFTCTCSFKTPESSPLDVQDSIDLWKTYPSVLKGKSESDFPPVPGADFSRYLDMTKEQGEMQTYIGLDTRKVDMTPHNKPLDPLDRRQLLFYRADGALGPEMNPNLHACAHLYASDINSLFIVANLLDISDVFTAAASISHNVIFHVPVGDLLMEKEVGDGERKLWYCKEDWTTRAADGRCMHHGRLVGPGGRHVASTVQDGVMRMPRTKADYQRLSIPEKKAKL